MCRVNKVSAKFHHCETFVFVTNAKEANNKVVNSLYLVFPLSLYTIPGTWITLVS